MSGLIYEVAWVRSLELIFGTTTFAVATVLAAFMGGLACGSYFMGRLAPRWRSWHPLRLYALLEVLIAASALLIPFLLHALVPVYQSIWSWSHASFFSFSLLRLALCALVLLLPTLLMGATLPVVSRFVSAAPEPRPEDSEPTPAATQLGPRHIGLLYTFNTLGAVLGCAAAGLVLFPAIGLARTQWIAVLLNLAAAAGSWQLARLTASPSVDPEVTANSTDTTGTSGAPGAEQTQNGGGLEGGPARGVAWALVTAFAVSGFVAMLYEVAWSRVLVLVLGSSTYACTIMLTTFLLGLALGAGLITRWLKPGTVPPLVASGLCQLVIAATTYVSLVLVEQMPFYYLKAYEAFEPSPRGLLGVQFLLAMALMILPTLGLGAMFPITIQGLNPSGAKAARVVGWAYALNTVGAIAGSVLAGFLMIPQLGSQRTMLVGIAINGLLGLALWMSGTQGALRRYRLLLGSVLLLLGGGLFHGTPRWDPAVMSSGVFRYVRDYLGLSQQAFRERARKVTGEVLLFDEGLTCTVTVFRNPECLSLLVNGKPDASTPSGLSNPFDPNAPGLLLDLPTQILLGQLPLLLAPRRDRTLVIGLGSGLTVGSVLTHPVKQVDCVELEHAVVEGSRFFEEFNHRPLDDPRTRLVVNDARNHLLVTDQRYDVIISEPSNPWIPGAANLFTREFFEISRRKLSDDGVFCQWIQLYELQGEHFESILRTFTSVFPEAHLFRVNHDAMLIGSPRALGMAPTEWERRLTPRVREDLARIRVGSVEDLLARYWVGGAELKQGLEKAGLNTDDNMRIEFAAPLQILASSGASSGSTAAVSPAGGTATGHGTRPSIAQLYEGRTSGAISFVKPEALAGEPGGAAGFWARVAESALREGMPETRIYSGHSLKLQPNARAAAAEGTALLLQGASVEARRRLEESARQFPESPELARALAQAYARLQEWPLARRQAERWTKAEPADPLAWFQLGRALFYLNEGEASLEAFRHIPSAGAGREELKDLPFYAGALQVQRGDYAGAATQFHAFLQREPAHVEARVQLAEALFRSGHPTVAAVHWQRVAQSNTRRAAQLQEQGAAAWVAGRQGEALSQLEEARRLDPANADTALMLARLQVLTGKPQAATRTLQRYLEAFPDRAPLLGYLSQLLKGQAQGQEQAKEAGVLAARYRALTGTTWEELKD